MRAWDPWGCQKVGWWPGPGLLVGDMGSKWGALSPDLDSCALRIGLVVFTCRACTG